MSALQQISGLRFCQRDEQIRFLPLRWHLLDAIISSDNGQFLQQLQKADIPNAGFYTQSAADGTHHDNIVPSLDMFAGTKCINEDCAKQTACGVVDINQRSVGRWSKAAW